MKPASDFRTLAGLRDTLLPKLMQGEVRVKENTRLLSGGMSPARVMTKK